MVYDRDMVYALLKAIAEKLRPGARLTMRQYEHFRTNYPKIQMPSVGTIRRYMGGWGAAMKYVGLQSSSNTRQYQRKRLDLDWIMRSLSIVNKELGGSTLTKKQYEEYRKSHPETALPSSSAIEHHVGSWNRAILQLGIMPAIQHPRKYTQNGIKWALFLTAKTLKTNTLSISEYDAYRKKTLGLPSSEVIIAQGGGWNNALKSAGLLPHSHKTTPDEIIKMLQEVAEALGTQSLTMRQYEKYRKCNKGLLTASTIHRAMGGWRKATNMAGLTCGNKARR